MKYGLVIRPDLKEKSKGKVSKAQQIIECKVFFGNVFFIDFSYGKTIVYQENQ